VDDKIDGVVVTFVDVTDRRLTEQRLRLMTAELDHRVKNILARVAGMVEHSREHSQTAEELTESLKRRLQSMATAHGLLSRTQWAGASIKEVCAAELSLYSQGNNVAVSGEDVVLRPSAAQGYSLVIHELTTNAIKHGSLSSKKGRVEVELSVQSASELSAVLVWRESGGPAVRPPERRSFGLKIIEEMLRFEFGAKIDVKFEPAGLVVRIAAPLANVGIDV
jgi:two-component sensor histidine kinase